MRTFALFGAFSLFLIGWSYWDANYRHIKRESGDPMHTPVVIKGDSLYYDSLALPLNTVPKARDIYTVSKTVLDTWAHMFIVFKIEESGRDGHLSKYGRLYNNLVGMRFPKRRPTTAIGKSPTGYAIFRHWWDCVLDFEYFLEDHLKRFEKRKGRAPKTEMEFVNFIFKGYNGHDAWLEDIDWLLRHISYEPDSGF